jgi:xylulokinase
MQRLPRFSSLPVIHVHDLEREGVSAVKERELFAGYDIGTTSSKISITDNEGRIVASAKVNHSQSFSDDGYPEQDARVWWQDFLKLTAMAGKEIPLSSIKAIGLSSMCPNVLPVSGDGTPLRKSFMYGIDQRAAKEIELLNEFMRQAGDNPLYTEYSSQSILPKILWLRKNEPQIFERTARVLTANGYIAFRLTGQFASDIFSLSAGNLIDLNTLEIFEDPFDHADLPTEIIPDIKWATDLTGKVTRRASEETGLVCGTPVFTGTGDACSDAITNACLEPGNVSISLGGTSIYIQCLDRPVRSPALFVETGAVPGSFTAGGATSCGGLLTDWVTDRLFGLDMDEKESLLSGFRAEEYEPSNMSLLPFFGGARTPFNNPKARGILFGLSMETGRKEILSSVFEAIALDISMIGDEIKRTALEPNQICVSGGGARSEVLLQLIATVLDHELLVSPRQYDSATGAALIALSATSGKALEKVVEEIKKKYNRVKPRAEYSSYMKERKNIFKELYTANIGLFR